MGSNVSPKKTNWMQLASFVLIILLTTEVILLILQNRELKSTLKTMTASRVEPLKPGERVEPVKVQTLDGITNDLVYADSTRRYLLFVFSTSCPHCEKTFPVWQQIATNMKSDHLSIVGISTYALAETQKYAADKKPGFSIVSVGADTSFGRKYKVSGVPETILLKGDGTVVKVWVGELQPDQVNEIRTLLEASQASG